MTHFFRDPPPPLPVRDPLFDDPDFIEEDERETPAEVEEEEIRKPN